MDNKHITCKLRTKSEKNTTNMKSTRELINEEIFIKDGNLKRENVVLIYFHWSL